MGIGYLLLYAALAMVALWLIAELLLQNRAALIWRAVALGGFLCVVAGMRLKSVPVIGVGAAGFALGQVLVTLSVKRGRAVGWSLRRADGSLPGVLAKVPLLSAATGGAAIVIAESEVEQVGEVGPIEAEELTGDSYGFEEVEELASDGVYSEEPATAYYQQPQAEQTYYQPEYQQAAYAGQQWQQQPAYQYDQSYAQPQYQDPYAQQYYQDPYAAQQAQQTQQQGWEYQQPNIPQQQSYEQQQSWSYEHYQG